MKWPTLCCKRRVAPRLLGKQKNGTGIKKHEAARWQPQVTKPLTKTYPL
jgi:hypothetical protein